jgi:adenylate cyclase
MAEPDSAKVAEVVRWLIDGAEGAPRPEQVVERLCHGLHAAGVPLHRVAAYVRTLHPNVVGVRFVWRPGEPVDVLRSPHSILDDPDYLQNPLKPVFETGVALRRRLADPSCPRDFPVLAEFAAEGITDYLVTPLRFLSGEFHVVSWTTKARDGFSPAEVAAIESVVPPLARLAEIYTLRRTAITLLNTYIGHDAGERVLHGHVRRGDTTTLAAAIWISDLRGFTQISDRLEPSRLIEILNAAFDAQVPSIIAHGGEVLKFIGDGLLAVFPAEACEAALVAAEVALAAVAELDATARPEPDLGLKVGIGLHVGEVSYGNIGSESRLDFTCIGPAVNLAARLQGLAAAEGWPIALSEAFAGRLSRPIRPLGRFLLKGIGEPVAAFAPS